MNKTIAVLLITLFTLYTTQGYTTTAQVRNTVSQSEEAMNVKYQDAQLITFSDKTVKCTGTGEGIDINKTSVKITESGTYIFSGECTDGSITVKKGIKNVVLVLNGLKLTSASDRAAISCNASSEITLIVEDGTNNELADTEANLSKEATDTEDATDADDAVIKVKKEAKLNISGKGNLDISGVAKNGIKCGENASVIISDARIDIESANNAIASSDKIVVNSGTININAQGDGLKAANDISITGGTFNINSKDDALHSDNTMTVEGGTFIIRTGDDAMHADEKIVVGIETSKTGPVIDIKTCYEGLEAGKVYIYGGDIDIASSDDGINAAGKDLADTEYTIDIYGGDIFINAEGDGLDSNKDINIYGGTLVSFGQKAGGDNEPVDADGTVMIYGGTVFGAGSGGMITTPASGSQGYISSAADRSEGNMPGRPGGHGGFGMDSTSEIYGSGKVFTILDENSEVVYKTLLPKNVNYYIYSSADIDTSKTYTIDVTDVE